MGAVALASTIALAVGWLGDKTFVQMLVLIIASSLMMAYGVVSGRDSRLSLLSDPYFLMCVFLAQFFVIGALAMHFGFRINTPFAFPVGPERTVQVLFAFLVWVIMTVVGYRSGLGDVVAGRLPDFEDSRRKLPGRWIETILIAGAILGCFAWIEYQGGLIAKLTNPYYEKRGGGAQFRYAFVALQMGTLLMAWRLFASRARRLRQFAPLIAILAFQVFFFGLLLSARKYLFFMFFGLLTVWLLARGRASLPKMRVAVAGLILLAFFSVWGVIRGRPLSVVVGMDAELVPRESRHWSEGYLGAVAGPFQVACLVWELYPEHEPFQYGKTFYGAFVGFIPRAVWPEKPGSIGRYITRYLVGPYYKPGEATGYNVGTTVPGDFYVNFGWPGLIVGGFLFGLTCRTVVAYAVHGLRNGTQAHGARALLPAAFVMGLGEVRGDLNVLLTTYALSFVPLLLALTFFRFDVGTYDPSPETKHVGEARP
jgi:oligosaccharide repeat unit polymerase